MEKVRIFLSARSDCRIGQRHLDWGVWAFQFRRTGRRFGLPFLADPAERDEKLVIDYKLVAMNYGPSSVGLALTGRL
jgi:hypothetical protein